MPPPEQDLDTRRHAIVTLGMCVVAAAVLVLHDEPEARAVPVPAAANNAANHAANHAANCAANRAAGAAPARPPAQACLSAAARPEAGVRRQVRHALP